MTWSPGFRRLRLPRRISAKEGEGFEIAVHWSSAIASLPNIVNFARKQEVVCPKSVWLWVKTYQGLPSTQFLKAIIRDQQQSRVDFKPNSQTIRDDAADSIWSWPKWLEITGLDSDPFSSDAWAKYQNSKEIPLCFSSAEDYETVYLAMQKLHGKTEVEIDKIFAATKHHPQPPVLSKQVVTQLLSWSSMVSGSSLWQLMRQMEVALRDFGCHPYDYLAISENDREFPNMSYCQVGSCYPHISKLLFGENSVDYRVRNGHRVHPHALSFVHVLAVKVWDARRQSFIRSVTMLPACEEKMDVAWDRATHPELSRVEIISKWLDECRRYYSRAVEFPTVFVGLEKIEGFKRRFEKVLQVVEVDPDAGVKLEEGQRDLIRLPVVVHRYLFRRRDKYEALIRERLLIHEEWIRSGWVLADHF